MLLAVCRLSPSPHHALMSPALELPADVEAVIESHHQSARDETADNDRSSNNVLSRLTGVPRHADDR
jgi:predicted methyltransferase